MMGWGERIFWIAVLYAWFGVEEAEIDEWKQRAAAAEEWAETVENEAQMWIEKR